VLDGGTTGAGRPYFVMDLVKGVPITRYCDEHRFTPRQRLDLFIPVCQAIQHAHHKGIIHRDIKPSNVLIAPYDGKPVPKVIDFGIAKATGQQLTEQTLVTGFGAVVGTLEYMSPEQAELNQLDIDTRSDIYSLGVLLYELLTGTTPLEKKRLKGAAMLEALRLIREEEPPRPSMRLSTTAEMPSIAANRGLEPKRLTGLLRGELDWIVMKALEKDRNRRYETANGFAMDVQRYLTGEPVLAAPASQWYRLRKFARRNKGGLAVAALVLFFLAALGGVAGWAALQQVKQQAAQRAALEADIGRDLEAARDFCRQDRLREASAVLDHAQTLTARGEAGDELGWRVAQLRTDVDMATRLEAIRLESAATVKDGHFDWEEVALRYAAAFRDYGIEVGQLDPGEAAARIAVSEIREQLVTALDDWLIATSGGKRESLLAVLARADADAWRQRLRSAFADRNAKALRELARAPGALGQPPGAAVLMGRALHAVGEFGLLVEFLRRAQREHPDDFWLNYDLGAFLMDMPVKSARAGEAVGYLRAALGLRPNSPHVLKNLGTALHDQGDLPDAIAAFEKAIAFKPDFAAAHYNLGNALYDQDDQPGAIAAYRKAIGFKPDFAEAHGNLGNVLRQQGDLPGALAACRKAVALKPDLAGSHVNLGNVLRQQGDLPGAIASYRKSIALKPDFAEAHCSLGVGLQLQGEFAEALEELRRGHELGSKNPRWRYPSAQLLRQCQRLLELDGRLTDILAGKATPANAAERIELARLCVLKQRNRAALRFYEEAFAAQPTLLAVHRYNAACAAALAGCGRGKDADKLDDKERARLRSLALDWLCADLEAQGNLLDKEPARAAANVATSFQHWLTDPDFGGVRGPEQLAKLPEAERPAWQKLWKDVADLLKRAQEKAASQKK
jgi:tetratricopeptide (TPR) repeat protein